YVASEKWEWAYGLCEELLKIEQWKKTEFHEKVLATAGDTSVKIVELHYKRGLYKDALARAQTFLQRFPKSRHRDDALLLAANSALALKDKRQALSFFEPLLKSGNAKPDTLALAYLTSTSVSEEVYDFKAAAAEMRKYMGVAGPPNNLIAPDELRKARVKTLMLSVLSGDPKDLAVTLNSKVVCSSPRDVECERYQGVSVLLDQRKRVSRAATEEALSRINKVDPSNRVYFATVALEDRRGLSLEDNFKMFQYVQVDFAKLDWILRYNILTPLSTSVPDAVRQSRKQIKTMSKLKIAKAAIDKRVKLMTQLENSANKLLVLPSILIRVNVLNELANMYDDFLVELTHNAVPAGSGKVEREAILASINPITQPFTLKRNELRKKAFDLASENAVGDETFESVSTAFFNENPEVAKTLRPGWLPPRRKPIDVTILDRVDPDGGWNKTGSYKALVYAAIRDRDWPRAAFFMQEIENKSELSEPLYFVVKAAALAGVGAQAEALVKLLEAADKMSSSSSAQAALLLECIPRLYRSYSKLKVKTLIEKLAELRKPNDLGQEAITIAHAARWAEADLSGSYRSALFAFIPVDRVPTSEPQQDAKTEAKAPQQEDKQ
ncbi:MAG TPA: hypothetical protein VM598_14935, partial [Bdellovibrionota bacterium]|nr:hypothetical protein [Bdellovibrionota bacterium]